ARAQGRSRIFVDPSSFGSRTQASGATTAGSVARRGQRQLHLGPYRTWEGRVTTKERPMRIALCSDEPYSVHQTIEAELTRRGHDVVRFGCLKSHEEEPWADAAERAAL